MKNRELSVLVQKFARLANVKGTKLQYAIKKNTKTITDELIILRDTITTPEKFIEFENKRIELAKELSNKDESGNAKQIQKDGQNVFDIPDDKQKDFKTRFDAMKEEYKDAIEEYSKQMESYNELMDSEANVTLYKIKFADLPSDLDGKETDAIMDIIEE